MFNASARARRLVALGCLAAVFAAACSDDDGSTDTDTTEATGTTGDGGTDTTAAAPTGEPFVLGAFGTYSGPLALQGARDGIEAWAAAVNDAGGIDGHPVELHVIDDEGNPTNALTAVQQLVEQEGVIAIVGQATSVPRAVEDYLDEQGVPVIGGLDVSGAPFIDNPNWFAVGGSFSRIYENIVALIVDEGATDVGFIGCAEAPTCEQTATNVGLALEGTGADYAFQQRVPATLPDYTAVCLAAQEAGIDALTTALAPPTTIAVYEACAQQGLDLLKVGIGSSVTSDFLTAPGLDGYLALQVVFPFHDSSTDATAAFQEILAEYAPGAVVDGHAVGAFPAITYAAGKMFEAAVAAGGLGDGATAADVIAAMFELPDGETLDGLIPAVTYTEGEATVIECYFLQQVTDGAFTSPNGLDTTCD